ncbi:GntR family transcriptional regulator [Frigidibacter sp. MR17.24]|uniref:GntR family transcriptional regulator n=1 Tax=Frigidibacter sp. MR17.24 TaxID=3127345 RepID=UPI003012E217
MSKKSAEILYAAIIDRILCGEIRSGDVLSEVALAAESGLSRTPVREALQRLRRENVLMPGPRRTLLVRRMRRDEVRGLFEALGEVEGACARLASERMDAAAIEALSRIVDEADAAPEAFNEINIRFHAAIHAGAQNPVLRDVLVDLQLRSLPLRAVQFRLKHDRVATSQAEHRAILAAISARDGARAQALMAEHMAATLAVILQVTPDDAAQPAEGAAGA